MIERELLREKVFASGNLVHGTYLGSSEGLTSYFTRGITTGRAVNHTSGYTPDNICFGLLGEEEITERYMHSGHLDRNIVTNITQQIMGKLD